ncbi:Uncharacterised protein [Acinetobacter baumannii]|nr:Uncharacterised protein [Acinetobacter baumannii]
MRHLFNNLLKLFNINILNIMLFKLEFKSTEVTNNIFLLDIANSTANNTLIIVYITDYGHAITMVIYRIIISHALSLFLFFK